MAYLRLTVKAPSVVSLPAGSAKTVLQITAPTNQALTLWGFSGTFDGTSNSAQPGLLEVVRQTTAGTMSSATPVMSPISGLPETVQSTASYNASVEPTTTDVVWSQEVHPQSGKRFDYPFDKPIRVPGGGRIALRCNFPASVDVMPQMDYEE